MTKRQKGQCSTPGCHEKWIIDFGVKDNGYRYYCPKDFTMLSAYLTKNFYNADYAKKWFIEGMDRATEDKIAAS